MVGQSKSPQNKTVLNVFVASPSDVSDERGIVNDLILDINEYFSKRTGKRFESIGWEKDVVPGFGPDPQTVINDQIPQDYEIFIGIIWNTIGTPTKRAESGTVEEFNKAKARYDSDPSSVRLMLYFKDALPMSMRDIDPDQLKRVREFKASIADTALYSEFTSTDDFSKKVRHHLQTILLEWPISQPQDRLSEEAEISEEEAEISELEEVYKREQEAINAVLNRVTAAILEVNASLKHRMSDLQILISVYDEKTNSRERQEIRTKINQIFDRAASDMSSFVLRMNSELTSYRQHCDKEITAFMMAVPIYLKILSEEEMKMLEKEIMGSLNAKGQAIKSVEDFIQEHLLSLPRGTTEFMDSKWRAERVLQQLNYITYSSMDLLDDALRMLRRTNN